MSERERVIFGYLIDVLDATLPIVGDLSLAIKGANWRPEDTVRAWNGYADAFWRRTIPG